MFSTGSEINPSRCCHLIRLNQFHNGAASVGYYLHVQVDRPHLARSDRNGTMNREPVYFGPTRIGKIAMFRQTRERALAAYQHHLAPSSTCPSSSLKPTSSRRYRRRTTAGTCPHLLLGPLCPRDAVSFVDVELRLSNAGWFLTRPGLGGLFIINPSLSPSPRHALE